MDSCVNIVKRVANKHVLLSEKGKDEKENGEEKENEEEKKNRTVRKK